MGSLAKIISIISSVIPHLLYNRRHRTFGNVGGNIYPDDADAGVQQPHFQ